MWPIIFESNCKLSQDDFLAVMPCVRILRITLWRDFLIILVVPPLLAGGQSLLVGECRRIRELVPMAMAPSQGWNHAVMSWANPCVMSSVIILWLILTTPSIMKGLLLVELFLRHSSFVWRSCLISSFSAQRVNDAGKLHSTQWTNNMKGSAASTSQCIHYDDT